MAGTSTAMTKGYSLRRELHFRRGGADVGVDLGFELGEILLEHADQGPRGLVELGLVGPGLDGIEDMRLDAGQRGRHREAEISVGAEIGVAQRTVQRRPVPYFPPVQPVLTSQQSTPCSAMRSRSRLPYTDGSRGRNGEPKQVENSGCGSLPRPRSVPATFAV